MNLVEISSLCKEYITGPEKLIVLNDLAFTLAKGHTAGITGESGSGKTTLLNMIGGLDDPTGGRIRVMDKDITRFSEEDMTLYRRQTVSFIFQFHYLLKDFTALENVMMPSFVAGNQSKAQWNKAMALLNEVGLKTKRDNYPSELSGGERQRVAVARALINDTALVLADEPTGNLDEKNSGIVEQILFELVNKYHKSLILVSHDKHFVNKTNDQYELQHGQLILI